MSHADAVSEKGFSMRAWVPAAMPFVNHVEFDVTNLRKAIEFYSALLEFKVKVIPKMSYALWSAARKPGGGFSLVKRVRHGGTTAVFQVSDVDRYLAKAKKLGGKVVQKKSPLGGDMGYYGAFRDPFGNTIGLWSSH